MANYNYIEGTGVVVPDTSTIKTEVQQEYKRALGEDLDVESEGTPQARLIEAETLARKGVIENMALLANMFNPDQSYGVFLDSIGALFGIERVGATSTRVLCSLTGTAGTVIPANSQAKTTSGDIFYLEGEVILDNNGYGQGYFVSSVAGAIACPANSLNTIVTAVLGWSTVNNVVSGVVGTEQQSDGNYRDNIKINQYTGTGLLNAIRSNVMRVDGVEDCLVIDNPLSTNDTTSITGVTIPPHSLFICVDGGDNGNVAQAIFEAKDGGCGYTTGTGHTVTEVITDQYSQQPYSVSFDRPIYQEIDVSVELQTGQASAEIIEQVKQAIIDYSKGIVEGVDGLTIGRNVSPFEIASAITVKLPSLYIKNVEVAKHGESLSSQEIEIEKNERATIVEEDITVS